jgi:Flp pilus assembly protein TadB
MGWHVISPYIIPLAAFAVAIVAIVSGMIGQIHKQRMRAEQRMTMIARGMSVEDIEKLLGQPAIDGQTVKDPLRSLGNARRTAVVLISVGLGLVVFGIILTWIVQERDVLAVAGAGLIPLAIGIGFLVDYNMQKRELTRFGLEVDPNRLP